MKKGILFFLSGLLANCCLSQENVRCDEISVGVHNFFPGKTVVNAVSSVNPGAFASWVYYKTDSCGVQKKWIHLMALGGFTRFDFYSPNNDKRVKGNRSFFGAGADLRFPITPRHIFRIQAAPLFHWTADFTTDSKDYRESEQSLQLFGQLKYEYRITRAIAVYVQAAAASPLKRSSDKVAAVGATYQNPVTNQFFIGTGITIRHVYFLNKGLELLKDF